MDAPVPQDKLKRIPLGLYASQFYADGGNVRPLMTGYVGQYYKDGGAVVDQIIALLKKLRGMK